MIRKILAFALLVNIFSQTYLFAEENQILEDRFYPFKICPSLQPHRWNVVKVEKKSEISGKCDGVGRPLSDYIENGTECIYEKYKLICSSSTSKISICVGIPGVNSWDVTFGNDRICPRMPVYPLSKYLPTGHRCRVDNYAIICFPDDFREEYVYKKPDQVVMIKSDEINCPRDAVESIGDVDKVICIFGEEKERCDLPSVKARFNKRDVCKKFEKQFVHLWYLKQKGSVDAK